MSGWASVRLEEIDELDDGRCRYRPVRHHLGITAFGINAWSAPAAGDRLINEHDEAEPDVNEELYLVLEGRAAFELDGERLEAPAGTLVFVRPGVMRAALAEEPGTTILAVGGVAGEAYEADGWELWAPVEPLYRAGRYAEAADRALGLVESHPEYPALFYALARCESMAGRKAHAVGHLREAIEHGERFRSYAKDDPDLDPIRDEPAFKELIAG
jgi:hypothetical protein